MPGYMSLHGTAFGLSLPDMSPVVGAKRMQRMGKLLYMNTAASTAVTATSTETLFDTFATVRAKELAVGSLIKIRFWGIATATNSTDTLIIKLYFGGLAGTPLLTLTTTDVATNDIFMGEHEITIRTIGTSGTMIGVGTFGAAPAAEGTITYKNDILASTTIDTTVAQVIGVSAKWSTTNAGNSARLDLMRVEHW